MDVPGFSVDGTREKPHFNVTDIDVILGKKYNRASLEAIVHQPT
ncbi:hypothetical protein [Colwellia sp. MT41]|nr:hypothetical protein [Colwellia sp. MT41]